MLLCGILATVVITLLIWVVIMPKKRDGAFRIPLLQQLHNYFHLKKLYTVNLWKYVFVLLTVACVVFGVVMQISDLLLDYVYVWYLGAYRISVFRVRGLLLALLGPVAVRLVQEFVMAVMLSFRKMEQLDERLKSLEESQKETKDLHPAHKQNSLHR